MNFGLRTLVLLQLDGAKQVQARERMTRQAALAVAVAQEAVDATVALAVSRIVGICQGEAAQDPKLRLDEVEPGRVGGREDGLDAQTAEHPQEARMIVDVVQIIHDDEEPAARIAAAQTVEGLGEVQDAFATPEHAAEAARVDVVEAETVLDAVQPPIGCPHAVRTPLHGPGPAAQRFQLQRPPLVEADHRRA